METFLLIWVINGKVKSSVCSGTAAFCQFTKNKLKMHYPYTIGQLQVRREIAYKNGKKVL